MDCETFESQIEEFLDGCLAADESAQLEQHGRSCERCGRALELARRDGDFVGAAISGGSSAGEMRRRVLKRIRSEAPAAKPAPAAAKERRATPPRRRTRPRRRSVLGYLAAAAVVAVVAGVGLHATGLWRGRVRAVGAGTVKSAAADAVVLRGESSKPAGGERLLPGDVIRSGSGLAVIDLGEGARFTLAPGTSVRFGDRGGEVALLKGDLHASTGAGEIPAVRTAHGIVRHIGTEFAVNVTRRASVVVVADGEVQLSGTDGASVRIGKGMQSVARAGRAPAEPFAADIAAAFAWTKPGYQPMAPRSRLRVAKMLFSCDFEKTPLPEGWRVERVSLEQFGGSGFGAAPLPLENDKWFRGFVRGPWSLGKARLRPESVVSFRYYATDVKFLDARIYNITASNQMCHRIEPAVLGRWTRVVLRVKDFKWHEQGTGRTEGPVVAGEMFAEFKVYAGRPGEPMPEFVVDDVEIFDAAE